MSDSDLSLVQHFLKRCHKQHFISYPVDFLKSQQDRSFLFSEINKHKWPPTKWDNTGVKRSKLQITQGRVSFPKNKHRALYDNFLQIG